MNLSKELARQAKAKGICTPWHNELLKLQNKEAMVKMYLKGIDFCLANNYPPNDFIREHFKGVMEEQGVFLDDSIKVVNMPKCVCLGTTCGSIEAAGYEVCEIYVKHNSELNVIAKDNAFVMIDIYDDAIISVYASDRAKVCVNHHGGSVNRYAMNDAIIKIREKDKKTY